MSVPFLIGSKWGGSSIKVSALFQAEADVVYACLDPLIRVSLQVGQSTCISPAPLLSENIFPGNIGKPEDGIFTILQSIFSRADFGLTSEFKALLKTPISNSSPGLFRQHRLWERNSFGKWMLKFKYFLKVMKKEMERLSSRVFNVLDFFRTSCHSYYQIGATT